MTLDHDTFIYDGDCSFCAASVRWLQERSDGSVVFAAAEPGLLLRAGLSSTDTDAAAILVTTDGRRFVGSLAFGEVLRRSPRYVMKLAGRLLLVQPGRPVGEWAYRWIARNRHRLPHEAAPVPLSQPDRPVRVEASGVVLREYRPGDAADLLLAFADDAIARWNPGPTGPDAAAAFMNGRNDWSAGDHASWAVADASDRLVGSVSLHKIDADQGDAEIGYWVAPWARRSGYATRAVVAASRFAFTELGLRRVYLFHAVENPASCGVALAAGFLHEGTLRQSFRYADGVHHDEHLHGLLASDVSTTPPATEAP